MLRFLTAGESHGPAVTVIIEGLPAGLLVDRAVIDADLKRRQGGYGRGGRMKIEADTVEILSGIRHGQTLGSPIALLIRNRDHENWRDVMSPDPQPPEVKKRRALKYPRPGHADLAGALKYDTMDLRNVLERASARETTCRVAAGALARILLSSCAIQVRSHVLRIGTQVLSTSSALPWDALTDIEKSPVSCADAQVTKAMMSEIDQAKRRGDTVGGIFEIVVQGLPPGLGSFAQWDLRLDGRLAQALMSIPAIKAVALGDGFKAGQIMGSSFHDEIFYDDTHGLHHGSNRAGGLEGGITNGEELRAQAVVKPIPTLLLPLRSIDLETKKEAAASVERSDTCVVPAAAVVGEATVCLVLADALMEKLGGDSLPEMLDHLDVTRRRLQDFLARQPRTES